MVNLLNSGKILSVRPELAQLIGLNEALFIQQLHYWIGRSNHHYDGHTWVYNTVEQWNKQFTFWSYSTVKRTINSLREQGLVHTTDQYNRLGVDRRLWYTIDYEKLSTIGTQPPITNDQPPAQNELLLEVNIDNPVGQDELAEQAEVEHSLYRTKNTNKDFYIDSPQTTTELSVVADPVGASHFPECVTPDPSTSSGSDSEPTTSDQQLATSLQSHGLSQPIALSLTQQHDETYLQEKISYLEYQLNHRPTMTNPAGWLRCAIQQNYAPPPGYHAAQQAAAEKQKWQAIAEEHTRQLSATNNQPPTTNNQPPATSNQPPATNNQQPTTSYQ